MTDIIFRQVKIPGHLNQGLFDVSIRDGIIHKVCRGPCEIGHVEINGAGRWLLPGAVDMHVHLREPGAVYKEGIASGTRAALAGGITTVADMPNNTPPATTADTFLSKCALADHCEACDVKLYMALNADNVNEIEAVLGHPRFAGIKVFLGATTGNLLCHIDSVIRAAESLDALFVFHAESNRVLGDAAALYGPGSTAGDHLLLRPVEAALESVRDIVAAHRPGNRFHICHISTAAELALVSQKTGITCEATPHHLAFNAQHTAHLGNLGKMNPPLRNEADRAALTAALTNGQIDAVATDHAPHTLEEKAKPYPSAPAGVPGVDTMVAYILSLVQTRKIDMDRAVDLISTRPAALLGLHDRGRIEPGLRADMMLWDPESTWKVANDDIKSKCGWSPFSGMTLAGRPDIVCMQGKIVE